MFDSTVEVSIKGRYQRLPAQSINGQIICVKGKWIRVAGVQSEGWLERELVDPEACLRVLGLGPKTASADIFTFSQKLPERLPKYDYPVEWDSIATLDTTSFQR